MAAPELVQVPELEQGYAQTLLKGDQAVVVSQSLPQTWQPSLLARSSMLSWLPWTQVRLAQAQVLQHSLDCSTIEPSRRCCAASGIRCFCTIVTTDGNVVKIGVQTTTHLYRLLSYVSELQSVLDRRQIPRRRRKRLRARMASLRTRCSGIVDTVHATAASYLLGDPEDTRFR